jgi:uncharacterized protein YbjQ (UPF0145 family)
MSAAATTSDLSIDEVLLLHSIGWEPVELVVGASACSIPQGVWQWGSGEIVAASAAYDRAVTNAVDRIQAECHQAGGWGVVGVEVGLSVERHMAHAVLVGTAVRPSAPGTRVARSPFVSDLSARDFSLLHNSGWEPLGLAFGAAFVYAPRRSAQAVLQQKTQNVELANYTEALYEARESAMERMQESAMRLQAAGVVAVNVSEGPMHFAHHAVGFTAWGTAVRPGPEGHRDLTPQMAVTLDDNAVAFAAEALRGR